MKKILFALSAAALSMAVVSCDNASNSTDNADKALVDSLSMVSGEYTGYSYLADYSKLPKEQQAKFKKSSVLRGIEQVLLADTADQGYIAGIGIGMDIYSRLSRLEMNGVSVDRKKYMAEFAKAFKADSVDEAQLMLLQAQFQQLNSRAQAKMMEEMQRKTDEESIKNKELGEKFINSLKADDPDVKTTESGLCYKVVTPGSGKTVGEDGSATVKYSGKLVDGTEFDNSDSAEFTPANVVPGFGEGLKMMQKGGHYILYIPAELAYGKHSVGSIPPMSTLVFDVEVLDVK